jgi:carbonic anhydrase/acetyltransferase-like protein (isoleucine patch superfamily)
VIRSFEGTEPTVAESAHVDDAAVVVGDVVLEAEASVWPNATLRGDSGRIVVGEGAVVGAGSVVTEGTEIPPETLAVGSPATVKTELDDPDTGAAATHHRELSTRYAEASDRLDG